MADITDLNINYVINFLEENGIISPKTTKQIYDKAFKLMMKKTTTYNEVDISIIEWMLAYNAIQNNAITETYHIDDIISMTASEQNELAKSLGMKGNNINNIINILRYMHKLYKISLTGNYDIDKLLLQTIDSKELNNLVINNYMIKILDDQNFWKERLQKRLGLKSNIKNIDYKLITKFLDNGKSFEENYQEALKKYQDQVVDILLENEVVLEVKPFGLLDDLHFNMSDLQEIKNLPYDEFIKNILDKTNEILEGEEQVDISYFNEKVYDGDGIIVEMPISYDYVNENEHLITHVFKNKNGFTNGQILYELAQKIPSEEEIKANNIRMVEQNHNYIIDEIKDALERTKRFGRTDDLNYIRKYYNFLTVGELLKDPVKFLKYNEEHPNDFITNYNSTYIWGDHGWWEGLSYHDGKYHVNLGS